LKIVTFNINNINKRLDNLVAGSARQSQNVVCLQSEASSSQFPDRVLRELGYRSVWQGERSWNGVAILRSRPGTDYSRGQGLPW